MSGLELVLNFPDPERVNEKMRRAREVVLSILKPSRKDIEHGLELHRDFLVCESYGFSPRAAVDGDALREAVEAGASEAELQDMTEDMIMTRYVTDPEERREYINAWEASGVDCILQNAGEEGNSIPRLLKRLARFTYVTDMMGDFVTRAAMPDDILKAKQDGKRCLYMTCNGVPLLQEWISVEEELRYIKTVSYTHLTLPTKA